MRLLYASERPPFPFFLGGAARSAHNLMAVLAERFAVQCLALGSSGFAASPWAVPTKGDFDALGISDVSADGSTVSMRCGYTVSIRGDFLNSLARVIADYRPDVVWTQLDGVQEIARVARAAGRRTILFLRDAEDEPETLRSLLNAGVSIVCNSRFMAERVRGISGRAAHVVYPSLDVKFGVSGDPHGCITMINPYKVKGIDTFLEIARRMPAERFLLVESWTLGATDLAALEHRVAALTNVRFSRRMADVRQVYRQTKLLLVPSVWEEAFGRVVIEAQSCGIPVIASRRGGLPEAVGDGGICVDEYLSPDAWVTTIENVLRGAEVYRTLAQRALAHATAAAFTSEYAARRFLEICQGEPDEGHSRGNRMRSILARILGPRQM